MNANYFLFATLEHARNIAPGRVSQDRSNHPVLTGTPVAGMVYLDRPKQAGYFIFPDLSVRHEGKYRLSFSLFEELKNNRDEDKATEESKPNVAGDAHVSNRLEVKSAPFHVFSAKKFPGLTESTYLSRMVAEQGCRVRIRRDVRMRRRDNKGGSSKDWDEYEDQTATDRARMSATPDPNMYPHGVRTPQGYMEPVSRPRSASNASHQSFGPSISRRTSVQDMNPAYQQPQYGTESHTPHSGYSQPYGPSPTQAYATMPYTQQPVMQAPPPQYPQAYTAPPSIAPQTAPQQPYYGYVAAPPSAVQPAPQQYSMPPQSSYESGPSSQRSSVDYSRQPQSEYRRGSVQQPTLPPPPKPQMGYQEASYSAQVALPKQLYQQGPPIAPSQPQQSYSSSNDFHRPAPVEPMPPPTRPTASTPLAGRAFDLPPLQTTTAMLSANKLEASSPSSSLPQRSFYGVAQTPVDSHKRSFGHVFSDGHQNQPLRQGARPGVNAHDFMAANSSLSAADDEDEGGDLDPDSIGMNYRRADGRQIRRALPERV